MRPRFGTCATSSNERALRCTFLLKPLERLACAIVEGDLLRWVHQTHEYPPVDESTRLTDRRALEGFSQVAENQSEEVIYVAHILFKESENVAYFEELSFDGKPHMHVANILRGSVQICAWPGPRGLSTPLAERRG